MIFWRWLKPDEAEELGAKSFPMLRYYTVFNLSQMVLPEKHLPPARPPLDFEPIEACERIAREMPEAPVIQYVKARAYYSPLNDLVNPGSSPGPQTFVRYG